jgi:indole-3-glycerol phosphate synthase
VLAEIKRASPSKGKLNEITDVASLAKTYQTGGASAISVLTESRGFLGSLDDLRAVRAATNIPLLRKDFISTEYQILEARAAGADIILLIVAGLPNGRLIELKNFAEQLGLAVLVETHNEGEVRFAVDIDTQLLGINARDLSTFETDRDLFAKLSHLIPIETIKIAESAVRDANDVRHYRAAGADVVLIGEALVTGDAEVLLRQFTSV